MFKKLRNLFRCNDKATVEEIHAAQRRAAERRERSRIRSSLQTQRRDDSYDLTFIQQQQLMNNIYSSAIVSDSSGSCPSSHSSSHSSGHSHSSHDSGSSHSHDSGSSSSSYDSGSSCSNSSSDSYDSGSSCSSSSSDW
jgi:hypothetical protein